MKGIDLNQASFQYFGGVDFMKIEGLSHATVLTHMSEVGPDECKKFETGKQFARNKKNHLIKWFFCAPLSKFLKQKLKLIQTYFALRI